jgi:hypothetical protein
MRRSKKRKKEELKKKNLFSSFHPNNEDEVFNEFQ